MPDKAKTTRTSGTMTSVFACLSFLVLVQIVLLKQRSTSHEQQKQHANLHLWQLPQPDDWPQISLRTTGKTVGNPWDLGGKYPNQARLCRDWARAQAHNKTVTNVVLVDKGTTDEDGLCSPGRAGNMLLALFSVLMMVYNANVGYEFEPNCERWADGSVGIAAYLPQNVSRYNGRWPLRSEEERRQTHERMCTNPADPLPLKEAGIRWTRFAPIWQEDLRNGLWAWARDVNKPEITEKTVSIHIRCGDILSAPLKEAKLHGFGTLSFYLKHLAYVDVERIVILTPAFECNDDARLEDCKNGHACSEIVLSLQNALVENLSIDSNTVQIKDGESDMWTMHHMVFSDLTICSPITSFCGVVSTASKRAVHQYAPWANALSETWQPIVLGEELDNVRVDVADYLSVAEIRANNMTTGDILEHILSN